MSSNLNYSLIILFQLFSNLLLLLFGNLVGLYFQLMTSVSRKQAFERTKSCVESRVTLECEKEHQERLLLSVIPAHIAAEVCISSLNYCIKVTLQWVLKIGILGEKERKKVPRHQSYSQCSSCEKSLLFHHQSLLVIAIH